MEIKVSGKNTNPIIKFIIGVILIVVIIPFLFFAAIQEMFFRLRFALVAILQGNFIIFVYSDSPKWKTYIENNILPEIENYSIILNWSKRKQWKRRTWAVKAFRHWAGDKEFNPIAIVFCNFFNVQIIRFFKAFQQYKHGKEYLLKKLERDLFELVQEKIK